MLRVLIAFFIPWMTFFTIGRPFAGLVCLILQVTLIGWPVAAIWAFMALRKYDIQTGINEGRLG